MTKVQRYLIYNTVRNLIYNYPERINYGLCTQLAFNCDLTMYINEAPKYFNEFRLFKPGKQHKDILWFDSKTLERLIVLDFCILMSEEK